MRDIRDIKAAVVGTGFIDVVHDEALIGDAIARSHAEQRSVTVDLVPQEV